MSNACNGWIEDRLTREFIQVEPFCGRERGEAERESAGEILSEAPAESKDLQ